METWTKNETYLQNHLVKEPIAFTQATKSIRQTNLPQMEVSPAFGKFLYLLAKIKGAKRILEIGMFYGYSTMWLAKAVPDGGQVVSLELTERFIGIAQENINAAGLSDKVLLKHGDAAEILSAMIGAKTEPFDMIFIDAHKLSYPQYLKLCLQLSKPGTVICGDNIILDGELSNLCNHNPKAENLRQFIEDMGGMEFLESTALQTVGEKGYDGFTISVVHTNSILNHR